MWLGRLVETSVAATWAAATGPGPTPFGSQSDARMSGNGGPGVFPPAGGV